MSHRASVWMVLGCALLASTAGAGVFKGTVFCSGTAACAAEHPASNGAVIINPYGITHAVTFQDAGGTLQPIRICVADVAGSDLVKAAEWAVGKWNDFFPALHNCAGCKTWLEAEATQSVTVNFAGVLLHELGHCAMGLQHDSLIIDADGNGVRESTDYTISYGGGAFGLNDGADNVRGSKDDDQDAQGGFIAEVVHWFTKADNDPINSSVFLIDSLTYSRSFSDFAASGSSYSANANVGVAALLGQRNTQSVMGRLSRGMAVFDLSPDDVQTVTMARTGLDRLTGTADDYSVVLQIVDCANPHELTIQLGPITPSFAGQCVASVDFTTPNPPQPATATSYKLLTGAVITMNSTPSAIFNFLIPMFYGSFESGTYDAGWVVSP